MNLSEEAVLRQSLIQVTVSNVREPTHSDVTHSHRGNNIDYNHQNQPSLSRRWNHHQEQAGATSTDLLHLCWYQGMRQTDRMKQSTQRIENKLEPTVRHINNQQPPTRTSEAEADPRPFTLHHLCWYPNLRHISPH
jgi:hypothetical protein